MAFIARRYYWRYQQTNKCWRALNVNLEKLRHAVGRSAALFNVAIVNALDSPRLRMKRRRIGAMACCLDARHGILSELSFRGLSVFDPFIISFLLPAQCPRGDTTGTSMFGVGSPH